MELIPQGDTVKTGSTVVTSGLELMIPRGLVLGEVSRVEVEPTSLFQTAYLKPFVKNDSLTVVSVISRDDDN
jgi:rod shape-determining protein MreC